MSCLMDNNKSLCSLRGGFHDPYIVWGIIDIKVIHECINTDASKEVLIALSMKRKINQTFTRRKINYISITEVMWTEFIEHEKKNHVAASKAKQPLTTQSDSMAQ